MKEIFSYLIVLLAYAPGIYFLITHRNATRYPLIVFCFLGMFVFNASGSILVMNRHYPNLDGSIMTPEYIGILVVQVLIFYIITGPYIYYRSRFSKKIVITKADYVFAFIIPPIIILILALYYNEVGTFLVLELIKGKINLDNALEYRSITYGLSNFRYYRLGFIVLPSILGAHILLISSAGKGIGWWRFIVIAMCFIPSALLGEKSGVLYIFLVVIIAYSVQLSFQDKGLLNMINPKIIIGLIAAFIPTILTYQLYYTTVAKKFKIDTLIYRIFGVYSESIALSVRYVDQNGFLSGRTLPTIKGLLKHHRFDIETALHVYLSALFKDYRIVTTKLKGNIPVSAVTEGFINFGWTGVVIFAGVSFLTVILLQDVLLRMRLGVLSYTLMVWYAYLALNLSMYSAFYTFFSFIHTYVLFGIIFLYLLTTYIVKKLSSESEESIKAENF